MLFCCCQPTPFFSLNSLYFFLITFSQLFKIYWRIKYKILWKIFPKLINDLVSWNFNKYCRALDRVEGERNILFDVHSQIDWNFLAFQLFCNRKMKYSILSRVKDEMRSSTTTVFIVYRHSEICKKKKNFQFHLSNCLFNFFSAGNPTTIPKKK
jgi:hypothetical protein